jgi:hypothetical protein
MLMSTGSHTLEIFGERTAASVIGCAYCVNEGLYNPKAKMSTISVKILTF